MPDRRRVPGSAEVLTAPEKHNYRPQFGVIVLCRNAVEQEKVYRRLREQGLRCRVVTI